MPRSTANLFAGLEDLATGGEGSGETFEDLLPEPFSKAVRIERIVSRGQASPEGFWYDQEQDEWVVVLQGMATLEVEDAEGAGGGLRRVELGPGDYLLLPAHQRHRVVRTSRRPATVWLAVHFGGAVLPGAPASGTLPSVRP